MNQNVRFVILLVIVILGLALLIAIQHMTYQAVTKPVIIPAPVVEVTPSPEVSVSPSTSPRRNSPAGQAR